MSCGSNWITRRSNIIYTIKYKNINHKIIEVERDKRSLSTLNLFCKSSNIECKPTMKLEMRNIINNS